MNVDIPGRARAEGALTGRGALVTGASSGIGRSVALRLATAGAAVVATGRDVSALGALADEPAAAGRIAVHAADLAGDPDDLAGLTGAARAQLGQVSVLVHAAGVFHRAALGSAPLADLDAEYRVNLRAPYALTQALLADLEATGGDVVFVNSGQGHAAGPGTSQYAATKHGLRAVADSLRAELSTSPVRVCTILLGRTATPMQERVAALEGQPYRPEHLIDPSDVAEVIATALALPGRAELSEITMRPTRRVP